MEAIDAQNTPVITSVLSNTNASVLVLEANGAQATYLPNQVVSGICRIPVGKAVPANLPIQGLSSSRILYVFIDGARTPVWWWPSAPINGASAVTWNINLGTNRNPVWTGTLGSGLITLTIDASNNISFAQQ
ncbi:MAG: hypothetical protein ABIP95_12910 [Pelobium sp.]